MLWVYHRQDLTLQIQARFDHANKEYVLIIKPQGAAMQVERFSDAASFQLRLGQLERQLQREHWRTNSRAALRNAWQL